MEEIFKSLRVTLDQTFTTNFRQYIGRHLGTHEFVLISDYCIDDVGKPNDVIAFTIAPWHAVSSESMAALDRLIPTDIKKTSSLSTPSRNALNDPRFFHIAFTLDDISGFLYSPTFDKRSVSLQNIDLIIEMIKSWHANQPEGREKFAEQIKRFQGLARELGKRSASFKLFYRMLLTSMLASIVAYYVTREALCRAIVWLPDRDKIHDAFGGIYVDIFELNHWGLCLAELPEWRIPKIGYTDTKTIGKNLWYDPLVRLPDYIAGTIASWDTTINRTSKEKHAKVLDHVIADNPNCILVKFEMSKESWSFGIRPVVRLPFIGEP
ncbi:hypothetical protein [Burkholderia sp. LMU1-1-1.1]|uniref:hypothetical protein n=1 Tax=Burkholderia sp. LMU1-1-1.1 TaxID=3135266 RepID=UPI00343208A6